MEANSKFSYSGPLNEVVLLNYLAVLLQDLKKESKCYGDNMKITKIGGNEKIMIGTAEKLTDNDVDLKFHTLYAIINAKQAAEEYIKHNNRESRKLTY